MEVWEAKISGSVLTEPKYKAFVDGTAKILWLHFYIFGFLLLLWLIFSVIIWVLFIYLWILFFHKEGCYLLTHPPSILRNLVSYIS